jgi:hypothetical protein
MNSLTCKWTIALGLGEERFGHGEKGDAEKSSSLTAMLPISLVQETSAKSRALK